MSYFPQVTITFDAALRDLDSRKGRVRAEAAHALRYADDANERERAAEALIAVLNDDSELVRSEAAISLGELGCALAIEPLVAGIDDASSLVRQAATKALGVLAFDAAFAPLKAALAHDQADVRFCAASAITVFGAERAVEPLLGALGDADGEVAGAVALALGELGDARAIEPLAELLDHSDTRAQFDAAYALTELGDDRGYTRLAAQLADNDLAWDAIEALERIGQARAASPMAQLMTRRRVPPHLALRAAGALLFLDPQHEQAERAKQVLLDGLTLRKIEQRGVSAEQLGRVGGDWAIEPLRAAMKRRGSDVLDIDGAIAAIRERGSHSTALPRTARSDSSNSGTT